MRHLLIINIGPVQDFIASARRSRDLWFGSWLLSELAKAAAKALKNGGGELIFPHPLQAEDLEPESDFNVSNKILAVVPDPTLGRTAHDAVLIRLRTLRDAALGGICGSIDDGVADRQIDDLLEFYWAAVPLSDLGYAAARRQVETLVAQRKNTRNFAPVTWGDSKPKSSLDGQRESVIPESAYGDKSVRSRERLRRTYDVRSGERLCGVGLLKRHGQRGKDDRFFSTSHVAAKPLLARWNRLEGVRRADAKRAIATYISVLIGLGMTEGELGKVPGEGDDLFGRYDGHLLFEERLHDFFDDDTAHASAKTALGVLLGDMDRLIGARARPSPYYVVLQADGDRMGAALEAQDEKAKHQSISGCLTRFASEARSIVTTHGGQPIYTGGDDVLALLPLHHALDCARALADDFAGRLVGFARRDGAPTLSVGLAVCHHIDPLSDALQLASAAEKQAKAVPGKNALAVTVSKRSGADRTIAGHWDSIDDRLRQFVLLHRHDEVPDGLGYEWRDLTLRLRITPSDANYSLVECEALRVLGRKKAARGKRDATLAAEVIAAMRRADPALGFAMLAEELITAAEFAAAQDLAGEPLAAVAAPAAEGASGAQSAAPADATAAATPATTEVTAHGDLDH